MPPTGPPPTTDLYRLLDVAPSATTSEIETAWRAAIRRAHPDIAGDPDATAAAARLNLAREWLTDPDGRAAYDRSRRRTRGSGPLASGSDGTYGPRAAQGVAPRAEYEPSRAPEGRPSTAGGSSVAGAVGLLGVMAFFVALMAGITETAAGSVALVASVAAMGAALILALRGPAPPGR
jgi:curved DNA-binding protein CbpA